MVPKKFAAFCVAAGPYYGYQKGFAIVDVTDKDNFQQLCLISYPGIEFCHQGWVTPDNHYLYIDDELDGPGDGVPYSGTRVIDISDLSHVVNYSLPEDPSVFMHRVGRIIPQGELVEHLYPAEDSRESNTIEVYVSRLRRKLGRDVIRTIRGLGYKME